MAKKHQLKLLFSKGNSKTAISCKCGEKCGEVPTGTRAPEILKIYKEHIQEE